MGRFVRSGIADIKGHADEVTAVVFSPDGKRVASGSSDETIRIWDVASADPDTVAIQGRSGPVSLSPDGKRFVGINGDHVKVWDVSSGKDLVTLDVYPGLLVHVQFLFSPDGKRIAGLISGLSGDGSIRLWDASSGKFLRALEDGKDPQNLRIQPEWKANGCRKWRPFFGNARRRHQALGRDDRQDRPYPRIQRGGLRDRRIQPRWEMDRRWRRSHNQDLERVVGRNHSHLHPGPGGTLLCLAVALDGKRIVSAGFENTIQVWDVSSGGRLLTLKGHGDWVESVAFSPDGTRIVSGSRDKMIKVWEAQQGRNC